MGTGVIDKIRKWFEGNLVKKIWMFSGFPESRAIEKLDLPEVLQLLIEWICRFGVSRIFLTDNAESFKAETLRQLLNKYFIFHRRTPVYERFPPAQPFSKGAELRKNRAELGGGWVGRGLSWAPFWKKGWAGCESLLNAGLGCYKGGEGAVSRSSQPKS